MADARVVTDKEFQWWSSIEVAFGAKTSDAIETHQSSDARSNWMDFFRCECGIISGKLIKVTCI